MPVFEHVERRALLSASGVAAAKAHSLEVINTQIGVGSPSGPFLVNATTPHELNIYVFGERTGSHAFRPLRDISPKEIVINGVTFKNAKIRSGPVDESRDGIRDAIITVSPRSKIDLTPGTTSLTISGLTRPGTPFAHETWEGTAHITVSGTAAQPYQDFVAITLPADYPEKTLAFRVKVFPPSGGKEEYKEIGRGETQTFATDNATGTHAIAFFLGGKWIELYDNSLSQTRSPRPKYKIVFTKATNSFSLVRDGNWTG
jgi:hypothetical protein